MCLLTSDFGVKWKYCCRFLLISPILPSSFRNQKTRTDYEIGWHCPSHLTADAVLAAGHCWEQWPGPVLLSKSFSPFSFDSRGAAGSGRSICWSSWNNQQGLFLQVQQVDQGVHPYGLGTTGYWQEQLPHGTAVTVEPWASCLLVRYNAIYQDSIGTLNYLIHHLWFRMQKNRRDFKPGFVLFVTAQVPFGLPQTFGNIKKPQHVKAPVLNSRKYAVPICFSHLKVLSHERSILPICQVNQYSAPNAHRPVPDTQCLSLAN